MWAADRDFDLAYHLRRVSLPAPGQPGNDHVKALVPILEKLKLTDFDRYINVHTSAAPQTKAELWKAVGK